MDRGDGGKDGDRSKGEGDHAEETKKRKKVKRIEDFNNEDVVWAKMKGYSFWPAQITLQVLGMFKKGSGTKTMYHVTFLGGDWAPKWIPQSFIRKFEPEDTGPNRKKDYRSCARWEASHLAAMKIGLEKLLQTELVAEKKPETPKVAFTVCQYFVRGICERRFCKFLHEKPSPVPEKKEELTPYPAKRPEPTSVKKPEPTPVKKPEPTPVKKTVPTPVKKPEPTPVNKPEPSPVKKPEPSPVKKPQPTPAKEMYELWGGGGAPFTENKDGSLSDRAGTRVHLIGDVKNILHELKTDPKWSETLVAVASKCNEPDWGKECIAKLDIGGGMKMKDVFDKNCTEIYGGSKDGHLNEIKRKSGIDFKDMMFFDDRGDNCQTVVRLGVTVVYTPRGVTREAWNLGLQNFPKPGEVLGADKKGYW